jgi:hypothetical protein
VWVLACCEFPRWPHYVKYDTFDDGGGREVAGILAPEDIASSDILI